MVATFPELQPQLEADGGKALGSSRACIAASKQVQPQAQVGRAWIWPQTHLCLSPLHSRVPGVEGWGCGMLGSYTASSVGYGISKERWTVVPVPELMMENTYLYRRGQFS